MRTQKARIVIVGAGSGGISVASRLLRENKQLEHQILIIDPQKKHYYQPLWTLVGGGAAQKEQTERDQSSVIPEGANWLAERVSSFTPDKNELITEEGTKVTYEYLVVAAGIQLNWSKVPGLKESIGTDGVCSNYEYQYVDSTWENIKNFKGGNAIFTMPNTPVKCGGAPQKIMYLAEQYFRKSGVRDQTKVIFATASPSIFSVEKYRKTLEGIIQEREIETKFQRHLTSIDSKNKNAVFTNLETGKEEVLSYDMIHVTPPMGPPEFLEKSPLAAENGWIAADQYTLQHPVYGNVFSLGDCANLPTSKTGAAIRKQAPVVAENILYAMNNEPLAAKYDGYSSCPIVTGYGSLILAEFDYDNYPVETFPFDQSKERLSMYLMKKHMLPALYWNGMLKGLM
ncbi:FAD/NAD(P)-binding oxidoreductase [Paenisporosarcina sp. OV554]|uniref:FAD/NAD(P)-binding oxidoreductase n=1 Tax=Paenisporosarcina sp. OV554 TaxID=2135694 RepID=UPI000D3C3CD9|nr:FAD/NAD(P)-binding oxidoreductase [Paenisporosarcina sp. OV554]PUB09997.1 sulfide:quinone oxidoreductase [Paenisporosarcina sp. OV554]